MGRNHDVAVPRGADASLLERSLQRAHDDFLTTGRPDPSVRSVVTDSWQRSMAAGLDPEGGLASLALDDAALAEIRAMHPLAAVMPLIRRLLIEEAAEAGHLVAVSDAAGQLLWVEGSSDLRRRAEAMHFVPGADWSELSVGTNAPGTALALGRPVQIFGPEHLSRVVTPWSCSAAPIRDPDTGAVLGVLDLTGTAEVASSQSLSLVRATIAAAETELRLHRMSERAPVVGGWSMPSIEVLAQRGALLRHGTTSTRLSLRHSEILLLLTEHEHGLRAAELAVALSDDEQAAVTIRAELSRLRHMLGPVALESRPYRLGSPVTSDLTLVREALQAGRLRAAVAAYRGPVLPESQAPAVIEIREELHLLLRSALLSCDDPDALLSFADTQHGTDDFEIWQRVLKILPVSSPRYAQVETHLARLDDALG